MQALVAISIHPTFSKAMKKVNLMALRVHAPMLPRSHRDRFHAQQEDAKRTPEERALFADRRRLQQRISHEQDEYYSDCKWTTPLIQALKNFKDKYCALFVDWQVCHEYAGRKRNEACGRKHIERLLGKTDCMIKASVDDQQVVEFLVAIDQGGCPLVGFGSAGHPGGLGSPLRSFLPGTRNQSVWDSLRTVDIAIDQQDMDDEMDPDLPECVLNFMAGAPLVEHLSLRCMADPSDTREDQFDDFAAMMHLPSIRHIWFGGALPETGILIGFCQRHRDTLKQIVCTADLSEWTPRLHAARARLEQSAPWVTLLVEDMYENMVIVNEKDGYIHKELVKNV
ncbi:hypothetical protein LTS10_012156 [Elasticomyces elasticus]|nr:hypothetical protein LTS10_012156 [Elasticomyces elasticus]